MSSIISLRRLAALLSLMVSLVAAGAGLTFRGCPLPAIAVDVPASTGLQKVYVLFYVHGVEAQFESATGAQVKWQKYSSLGGGYAQDVPSSQAGAVSTLSKLEGNMGYIVTDGSSTSCFWIVDYSTHPLEINGLTLSPESDCSTTWLDVDGLGDAITYYGITGVPQRIARDFRLTYSTLEFDESTYSYVQTERTETLDAIAARIYCTPPLCQTDFTLSGDRFAREWGEEQSATSPVYDPTAVDAHTSAAQAERDNDNEVKDETSALGGSGPVEVTFRAAVTDAALYHEWELARDSEFNQTFLRYSDLEFTHTFREQGTTYVRLLAANDAGSCEFIGETYEVFVGESALKCPNAFSPGASEGVNDEWKVSYKSILDFDCQIFDNQGRRVAHLTHPSQGWNGRRGGKLVPQGVYYYVIRATGTDGKKYKLSGDINIIGFKRADRTSNDAAE